MKEGFDFPKARRLRNRREFEKVSRNKARLFGRTILVELLPVPGSSLRIGITVTKKYGKAHDRNRFKRCVREAFRLAYPQLPSGFHIVVRPKHPLVYPKTSEIKSDLLKLFQD